MVIHFLTFNCSFVSCGWHQGSYICNDRGYMLLILMQLAIKLKIKLIWFFFFVFSWNKRQVAYSKKYLMWTDKIVWISIAILVCLFMFQRLGTDKVGYSFAPIICVWFIFIGGIGVYNFIRFDPTVIKAINPKYIVDYFRRNKKDAWISLGGVVLAITGSKILLP